MAPPLVTLSRVLLSVDREYSLRVQLRRASDFKATELPRDQRPAGNAGGFQPNRSSHVSGAGRAQPLPERAQAGSVQVSTDVLWP